MANRFFAVLVLFQLLWFRLPVSQSPAAVSAVFRWCLGAVPSHPDCGCSVAVRGQMPVVSGCNRAVAQTRVTPPV